MTTRPTPCDRLDAYLHGRLDADAEAAFERHLDACDGCLEAVAPAGAEAEALASLAAVACPPEVLAAARTQARRAADRAPAPGRRRPRRTFVWAGAVALLAVAAASVVWSPRPEAGPVVAQQTATPPEERSPEPPAEPEPAPTEASEPTAPAPPAPEADRPRPRPAPASGPERERTAPPPAPEAAAAPDLAAAPAAPVADSVAVAREEMRLALAIVSEAQDRAAYAVADGVGRLSDALHASPPMSSPLTP